MSLRLRLLIVIIAAALPTTIASLITGSINRGIQADVGELRRDAQLVIRAEDVTGSTLEIELSPAGAGPRRPVQIDRLPRERRPKLRGPIEAVDPKSGTITLFGVALFQQLGADGKPTTESDAGDEPLRVGQRIEASCSIDSNGRWKLRKIKSKDLKPEDKIKGTVSVASNHSDGGVNLDIHGIRLKTVATDRINVPRGPLYRHETAARMSLTTQESLAAAHDLIKSRYLKREARTDAEKAARKSDIDEIEERISDAFDDLDTFWKELNRDAETEIATAKNAGASARATSESKRKEDLLAPLITSLNDLRAHLDTLRTTTSDLLAAQEILQNKVESTVRKSVLPRLRALELHAEEQLNDDLKTIAVRAQEASRLTLVTTILGALIAMTLGVLFSRTISKPVSALESAAQRIGTGDLTARVDVPSKDELGHLAETFNRMAVRLATSTVSLDNLNDVVESLAGGLFIVSPEGTITTVNPATLAMLGFSKSELEGRPIRDLCADLSVLTFCRGQDRLFLTKSGARIPVSFSAAPLGGGGADFRGFVCLAEDLSERKAMEAALKNSVAEKDLLLRELHHRVKNNLQVITSLLDLQSREIKDAKALEKFQESQDRIRSMALIHEQLFGARDLEMVDLRVYLGLLVGHLGQSHIDPPERVRLETHIEEIRLDLDRALSCGLIVNELVTNAIKHGFPGTVGGTIKVSCTSVDGRILLEVADDGMGFRENRVNQSETLGQTLIRDLAAQLGGEVILVREPATRFVVTFPVEEPTS
jgi:PAS domain S-box-containing protein